MFIRWLARSAWVQSFATLCNWLKYRPINQPSNSASILKLFYEIADMQDKTVMQDKVLGTPAYRSLQTAGSSAGPCPTTLPAPIPSWITQKKTYVSAHLKRGGQHIMGCHCKTSQGIPGLNSQKLCLVCLVGFAGICKVINDQ